MMSGAADAATLSEPYIALAEKQGCHLVAEAFFPGAEIVAPDMDESVYLRDEVHLDAPGGGLALWRPSDIGEDPGHHAPEAANSDRRKGHQTGGRASIRQSAEAETLQQKERQPCPHPVQFPHMAQIAEIRQPQRRVAPGPQHISPLEGR
jgi:hypothetical protein